jgi:hypothetical protein
MKLDNDRDTFSERLVSAFRAILRWTSFSRTKHPVNSRSALGCLNPFVIIRIVIVLLAAALMPLYLLPLLLVRMVTMGRTSIRYSATLDVTSGDAARWGYGALEPVGDPARVQAGTAAIAAHDPQFDPSRIMNWAAAATGLICESLRTGDATPTRTFMASGLFRSYQALLELRARVGVACPASWRATSAVLVDAVSTPLFDEVRVRLQCEGYSCELHEPTGLTLRGSREPGTWAEDLTFGRSADAVTPAAGGLPARRCPSCGAPLALDRDGACTYCHGIVTAGRHDWVLIGWRREPW